MEETLMTTEAATTPEGQDASQPESTTETPTNEVAVESQAETSEQASDVQPTDEQKGAPQQYETFKAPEGLELDPSSLESFTEVAKELNLSQEDAQKVIDKVSPVMAAKQQEVLTELKTQWVKDTSSDKEFGGDKLTENLGMAKRALDTFGTPELTTLLNETGLGNHPEVIRAFYRAGKAISEDGFVKGTTSAPVEQDPARRLFPNQM